MPNLILEHSEDIKETKELMQVCHDQLVESGLFKVEAIKIRPIAFSEYLVGGSPDKSFLGVTVSIMPGRSHEQKTKLGSFLHQRVVQWCSDLNYKVAISVCVKETPEGLYFK